MPLYTPATGGGPDMATEYTSTQPASPTRGLTLFTRMKARRLPAIVGPSGQDTSLQPGLFANRVARMNSVNATTPTYDGLALANVTSPAAVTIATTNFYSAMVRSRWSSSTTASTSGGYRTSAGQWFMSSTAGLGGFFFVCRFGIAVVPSSTQTQWFVGLSTSTSQLSATANPTSLLNLIGFGSDLTGTTIRFIQNAGGTATTVDLGANFPSKTAATYFYEVRMFSAAGAGQSVTWSATRLNDGLYAEGTATTNLPAVNTLMATHANIGNGSQAAAASIDIQSLYIETDN
jgi:hypothetical protein